MTWYINAYKSDMVIHIDTTLDMHVPNAVKTQRIQEQSDPPHGGAIIATHLYLMICLTQSHGIGTRAQGCESK